ncbi:hypothetical protein Hanom_Chr02g00164551 [Helianthus anomalus]
MNERSRTCYRTFTNAIERTILMFMFVHLTNRTKFFVHVRSFIKQTNVNRLSVEMFTNRSLNIQFVYNPIHDIIVVKNHIYNIYIGDDSINN